MPDYPPQTIGSFGCCIANFPFKRETGACDAPPNCRTNIVRTYMLGITASDQWGIRLLHSEFVLIINQYGVGRGLAPACFITTDGIFIIYSIQCINKSSQSSRMTAIFMIKISFTHKPNEGRLAATAKEGISAEVGRRCIPL